MEGIAKILSKKYEVHLSEESIDLFNAVLVYLVIKYAVVLKQQE